MHGNSLVSLHPFPGPIALWWSKRGGHGEPPRNFLRSLNQTPVPTDMFKAGGPNGWIDSDGIVGGQNRDGLHKLVKRLTRRIREEVTLQPPIGNPRIPAGYTYLLQFIAHDMVDSVLPTAIGAVGARNARSSPLLLETLYGSGPDESPQAYVFRAENLLGKVPRTHLRLGIRSERPTGDDRFCPFRDLARAASNSKDETESGLTEVMIADPRNDAHALLSQLTLIFHLLHNHILTLIEDATSEVESAGRELAYRRFACARLVVTLIYRNIIINDVLAKVLDDAIYERYVTNSKPLVDNAENVPLEFTFGAFRFGHSMVRDAYNVNSQFESQQVGGALILSSQQRPADLPVGKRWFIDWDLFFAPGSPSAIDNASKRNLSMKIGPHYALELFNLTLEKVPALDAPGLADRDLLSACYAGMLSVSTLCRDLRAKGFCTVDDFSEWQPRLEAWLNRAPPFRDARDEETKRDRERIIEDPPLPFFILFEAGHFGGAHLGPVGSILVAETVLGAIRRYPLGVEEGASLQERIGKCAELAFGESELGAAVSRALSRIPETKTMRQILEHMHEEGCFDEEHVVPR